jgi:peptide/nickel transport system permease protein
MARTILHRVGQSLVLLVLVSMIGFALLHLAPGGPLSQFALTPGMSAATMAQIAHQMGLDRPLPIQYLYWASRLARGDWGHSYRDGAPVLVVIGEHIGATLELMFSSTLLAVLIGTWVGVLGAVRRYSIPDYLATIGAMVALSIPTFWFGLVMIYLFAVWLAWLPSGNMYSSGAQSLLDYGRHLILPCLVLTLVTVATWSRYMRASMLDVISQDYIRTARAKGVRRRAVLIRHALRNALLPMITVAGLQLLDSIGYRDYPVVMGLLMVSAILVLIGNLMADMLYVVADPRIRIR